jgi:hypothetical protein
MRIVQFPAVFLCAFEMLFEEEMASYDVFELLGSLPRSSVPRNSGIVS